MEQREGTESTMFFFVGIAIIGAIMLAISSFIGDGDDDAGLDGAEGPGILGIKTISAFLLGTGLAGAVSGAYLNVGFQLITAVIGLAGGFVVSGSTYQFLKLVYNQQATSLFSNDDLVGHEALVSIAIPAEGVGQIACEIKEKRVYREARTKDNTAISEGRQVYIAAIEGGIFIVENWDIPELDQAS